MAIISWPTDSSDLGFMLHDNEDAPPPDFIPQYAHSNTPDPDLYQIFIHWKPAFAPFPITMRADMTINDVLRPLSALLQINQIYLFLFFEYRMQHLRRRLDDSPPIGPGTTLQLHRWSLQQAREWSAAYEKLRSK